MEYKQALEKAWSEISALTDKSNFSVVFLADEYDIDLEKRNVFSVSCNVPAKEYISILVLHYLIKRFTLKILPKPTGNWIDFKQLDGGVAYYPAFKKRTIDVILRKFGKNPEALLAAAGRFGAKVLNIGDVAVVVEAFEKMPFLITMWKQDQEFAAEANIVFDETIPRVFCTEDIVVLTEYIAHSL